MKQTTLPDGRNFAWHDSGSGSPLILIHGWGNSAAIFSDLITQLPDQHSLSPDLPGYGASTPSANVRLDTLRDDFMTWIDTLGHKKVTLLGWSLGGMIAMELAACFSQRIERLILISTTPRFVATPDWPHGLADTEVRALARDFKRAPVPTLEGFWCRQFYGERSIPSPLLPKVELTTALAGLEFLRKVDLRPQLAKITMPTLVLHGSSDVIIPVGAGRFLTKTLPQAHFHEVKGAGHAPFLSDTKQVCSALRRFLA